MSLPLTFLNGQFKRTTRLYQDEHSETWSAVDTAKHLQPCEQQCILRLWPFNADISDNGARVLWSREERRIRRLAGTAHANESLMTLKLSGREEPAGERTWYLVMVLQSSSSGYTPLSSELARPTKCFVPAFLKQTANRATLWRGLRRIADGIQLLHRQRILHRNVTSDAIFWDPTLPTAPETLRLGGFETSIRFGLEEPGAAGARATTDGDLPDTFPMDWFCLGVVLSQVFADAKITSSLSLAEQMSTCKAALARQGASRLTERERELIVRLLACGESTRIVAGETIIAEFDKIEESLRKDASKLDPRKPLPLVFNPTNERLYQACVKAGFNSSVPPSVPLIERNIERQAELRSFLRNSLIDAQLFRIQDSPGGSQRCVLVSDQLCLLLQSFEPDRNACTNSWEKAYVVGPADLHDQGQHMEELRGVSIEPLPLGDVDHYDAGQSWRRVLPALPSDRAGGVSDPGTRIHHFLRATNLLDLLITYARIFPYEAIGPVQRMGNIQRLVVKGVDRQQPLPGWTGYKDGLAGYLQDEMDSGKDQSDRVLLTDKPGLYVGRVRDCDWWKIAEITPRKLGDPSTERHIVLERFVGSNRDQEPPAQRGFIRSFGLFGLFTLINRRKRAIDRMGDNTTLLRMMELDGADPIQAAADMVPGNEVLDEGIFDKFPTRRCFFEDVDRVRPLYVLQGPPGTGKSTFVAHQLRRLFDTMREPFAQVLVTAQAHAGVDVLRQKVEAAFNNLSSREKPISIRLGQKTNDDDSSSNVAINVIRGAVRDLNIRNSPLDAVQIEWRSILERCINEINDAPADDPTANDLDSATTGLLQGMMQLLKRCAGITYCTASARDLAELADEADFDHTYDLVIVEEAGKIHAFDLVLPLSAGYSWLLIGDHKQLPAFQINNFQAGLRGMNEAVATLRMLPKNSRYIDSDWLDTWETWTDEEKRRQTEFSTAVLRYFKWLHESLGGSDGERATQNDEPLGTGAGMLSDQFRMPAPACSLISNAFYGRKLVTGEMLKPPTGSITLQLHKKELDLSGQCLVWLDTPWCQVDPRFGEADRVLTNRWEARAVQKLMEGLRVAPDPKRQTLAGITPYRRQLGQLRDVVGHNPVPPSGCAFVPPLNSKAGLEQWIHTVDSFQGNEADIVITSLVRNNPGTEDIKHALGFLADGERINVLLSRSKRLLIIVGSWDFFRNQLQKHLVTAEDENHELWFLRSVTDQLEGYFKSGMALKIPFEELLPRPAL
jgi:hypothetical protein